MVLFERIYASLAPKVSFVPDSSARRDCSKPGTSRHVSKAYCITHWWTSLSSAAWSAACLCRWASSRARFPSCCLLRKLRIDESTVLHRGDQGNRGPRNLTCPARFIKQFAVMLTGVGWVAVARMLIRSWLSSVQEYLTCVNMSPGYPSLFARLKWDITCLTRMPRLIVISKERDHS